MATSRIQIDEGSTLNLASNTITEDALTKHVGRSVLNNSSGTEVGTNANPIQVGDAGGSLTVDGTVAATQSGAWNVTDISGTVSLPTGAATAANQTTIIGHVDGIEGLLTTIDADTSSLAGAVAGTEVQVDVVAALPAGTNAIGKLAANSGVDIGDVDVTSVTPGTTATALGKAEDAAHTSGDVGVQMLGVRNDAMAALSGTDLDYTPVATTSAGRVQVTTAAHSAMLRGFNSVAGTGDTAVTGTISGDAGLKTYITDIQVANTGSSTTLITFKDGSGGSTLAYTVAPAGGGSNIHFTVPLVTTANTALFFACGTSSTTVYVSAQGYKAP